MDRRLLVTDPPANLVVSVDEVKAQARLMLPGETDPFGGAEDALIERLIRSATDELSAPQGWLGRSLLTQGILLSLDFQPTYALRIPCPPVQSVDEARYLEQDGSLTTIDLDDFMFDFDADESYMWPRPGRSWPVAARMPGRFKIRFTAGYGNLPDDVPEVIRDALLIMAATKYRDRESTVIGTITSELVHVKNQLASWRVT
jgi:uncharacterized phiE125 gp8 family phage protein